ncbi:MAG: YcaQ family DNA glycosylase [Planctomycetes bacterium]|nr:YcaQ family DNA glycosylase [Planctomycetota bacterium]
MTHRAISLNDARRIALAAQGFDRSRPRSAVGLGHIRRVIRQLGLIQLDFVNNVVPAHYQVLFSRLGPYNRSHLDRLVYSKREFTEQWAHEASIVPMETWPLLRHRMEKHRVRPWGFEKLMEIHREYVTWVLAEVRARGPLTADVLPPPEGASRRIEGSWFGSIPRAVLEAHFGRGLLAVAQRLPNFARTYDLAERVVAEEHHGRRFDGKESQRALLGIAARAHGIGTAADLADYFRMSVGEARPRLAELVAAGELTQVRVEGWREPAYLHRDAKKPARIDAATLLSPFDPLIWFRPRTARLFNFDYRFEIFVPQHKRRWGVYVLPFLLGDRLVARVDLKSDRPGRRLGVLSAFLEPDADARTVAESLARELHTFAGWLGLETVSVGRRGDFARALAAAVRVFR